MRKQPGRFSLLLSAILSFASCAPSANIEQSLQETRSADAVQRYDIFELTLEHNGAYENKFFDLTMNVTFTSPSGSQRKVKGFFYGGNVWKARFVPDEVGRWTYSRTVTDKGGLQSKRDGAFECTASTLDGPVRRHADNPYRWVFASGWPYFPIGLNECIGSVKLEPAPGAIDGERRTDVPRTVSIEEYFDIYGKAGFNLLRFSQDNCTFPLFDDLDHYRESESIVVDKLAIAARKHDFRIMFGFFGFHEGRPDPGLVARNLKRVLRLAGLPVAAFDYNLLSKEKRFIDYAVARWGAYIDFWELANERDFPDQWVTAMADHLRSVDPYKRPISTSWEKPKLAAIDINAPHWYESESELQSDLRVSEKARGWKVARKPVVVGEQGNTGMNWDPLSAQRMRIRTWTAFFQEIALVFWNTSWSKAGMFQGHYNTGPSAANIYLGPEERAYIRVLHRFSERLDAGITTASFETSFPDSIRVYGLRSNTAAGAYLHHFANHSTAVSGAALTADFPSASSLDNDLVAEWIDPTSGNVLSRLEVLPGRQTVAVPPFAVDLALLVTSQERAVK